ncbi:MAG: hypothetical protein RMY16_08375 [Nostoc sp. DedQUE12b]|uniref:hypothetical protein n=1 Tax=Nostoc sp. DedQUE12b TaxID=3075398 RepID=UPI002AD4BEDE|nr:hypothetical protein [Nostoc sp. DedQUE12b]MDZ8085597.1 hypothetical protein [Nostoc sp. DedQUE12b]
MYGFDGETKGLKIILKRIASNDDSGKLTHKEVRAYARCMLAIFEFLRIDTELEAEIKFLLAALSRSGIPHYECSFIALKILELLERNDLLKIQETSNEHF